jgi:hypothetical protein
MKINFSYDFQAILRETHHTKHGGKEDVFKGSLEIYRLRAEKCKILCESPHVSLSPYWWVYVIRSSSGRNKVWEEDGVQPKAQWVDVTHKGEVKSRGTQIQISKILLT